MQNFYKSSDEILLFFDRQEDILMVQSNFFLVFYPTDEMLFIRMNRIFIDSIRRLFVLTLEFYLLKVAFLTAPKNKSKK